MSTFLGHKKAITALCHVREGQLVSGSMDKSLIIWSKLPASSTYSPREVLIGHESVIIGIIRISNTEIISGDLCGDLKFWNIDQSLCIRHISKSNVGINQMKQHEGGEVALSYRKKVILYGASNNWEVPLKQFNVCSGVSIEFFSKDLLLRGGRKGKLEFIDYSQTRWPLPPPINHLHSDSIHNLQRIANNIVVTASVDRYLKVIDPISRKCYLNLKKDDQLIITLAYLY